MNGEREVRSRLAAAARSVAAMAVGVVAAVGLMLTLIVYVFLSAIVAFRVFALLGQIGAPGSLAIFVALFSPHVAAVLALILIARWPSGERWMFWRRTGAPARSHQAQPSDAEIMAAAEIALEHFDNDASRAIVWIRSEAVRCLARGDIRRNIVAVRMKRALEALSLD